MFKSKSKIALFLIFLVSAYLVSVIFSDASLNVKVLSFGFIWGVDIIFIPMWVMVSMYRVKKALIAAGQGWRETLYLELIGRPIPIFPTIQDGRVVKFLVLNFTGVSQHKDSGDALESYLQKSEDGSLIISQIGVEEMTKEIEGYGAWKYPYHVFRLFYENKFVGLIGTILFVISLCRIPILETLRAAFHWK